MRLNILLITLVIMHSACIYGQNISPKRSGAYSPNLDSLITALVADVDSGEIKSTMLGLQNFGSRFMIHENHHDVALWIKNQFTEMGYETTRLDEFETHAEMPRLNLDTTVTRNNVSAVLEGISDTVVIVGAHYDSFNAYSHPADSAPGADDNASGTAAVLEMARVFKQHQIQPYYTIIFVAFDAEELKYYSTMNGARAFADKMAGQGTHVHYMLNYDMIANDDTGEKKVFAHRAYEGKKNHNWHVEMTRPLAEKYTDLEVIYDSPPGRDIKTDDKPFSDYGFHTNYLAEYVFSPNYHSYSDVVKNCEMAYATEVVRLGVASFIHATYWPNPVRNLKVINKGDGSQINLSWSPSTSKVKNYKMQYHLQGTEEWEEITVSDTSVTLSDLITDSLYHIRVMANLGNDLGSYSRLRHESPVEAQLEQGILIINSAKENLTGIGRDSINRYYEHLGTPFVLESMNVDSAEQVDDNTLSRYSTVIWHHENSSTQLQFSNSAMDDFESYLDWGGHLLFSLYRPTRFFKNPEEAEYKFGKNHFARNILHIDSTENRYPKVFHYMSPVQNELPEMGVDTNKISDGYLMNIEAMHATADGEILYTYGSEFDSTSPIGSYHGKPVAISNRGEDINVVTTSVPLYYMTTDSAKAFVHEILRNKFGEYYVGIPERNMGEDKQIKVYPNPAGYELTFTWPRDASGKLKLKIFDMRGVELISKSLDSVYRSQQLTVNVSQLNPGIYAYYLIIDNHYYSGKFQVSR